MEGALWARTSLGHAVKGLVELHADELVEDDPQQVRGHAAAAGAEVGVDRLLAHALLGDPRLLQDGVGALNGDDGLVDRPLLAYAAEAADGLQDLTLPTVFLLGTTIHPLAA